MRLSREAIFAGTAVVCVLTAGVFYASDRRKSPDIYELTAAATAAPETTAAADEQVNRIKVYITGAVVNPGVYELDDGSRVEDVLIMAGGPAEGADMLRVNLAARLKDEQQIIVSKEGEIIDKMFLEEQTNDSRININTADESRLMELPGVGQVTAGNIIAYRTEYGAFKSIEDIKNVTRIGDKTFERLKDLIMVD